MPAEIFHTFQSLFTLLHHLHWYFTP